jgi:hypothetical protein
MRVLETHEFERDPVNRLMIGDNLRKAHPLVRQTSDALAHSWTDEFGIVWAKDSNRDSSGPFADER